MLPFLLSPIKGGVDAKELFHLYILVWIQDKRLSLLESCKLDKVFSMHCNSLLCVLGTLFLDWIFYYLLSLSVLKKLTNHVFDCISSVVNCLMPTGLSKCFALAGEMVRS